VGKAVLGEFEHQVLLAILHNDKEASTVSIVSELEERTGREVAPAAVYIALRRLQERKLLTSRMSRARDEPSGRARRYFRIQRGAMAALKESRATFQRLWEGLEGVLD
jgi:DNA-binding PadR family transcriptional regulator